MPGKRVYLGVDGGGSKTEAIAFDGSGTVLGVGRSGKSNYQVCGMPIALKHIREAAKQALAGKQADGIAYCLAGADTRPDFIRLEPELRAFGLGQKIAIYNDVLAIFRAGGSKPYGMGVVCGTGFNAGGISRDRREVRLPALGEVTGDFYAGGGWLGMAAMGSAFRGWDGRGKPTQLANVFLRALGVADMETLAELLSQKTIGSRHIHELVPLVFETANAGDEVACQLIQTLGQEIGVTIVTILRRLDLLSIPCDVVLGGSVFYGKGPLLLDTIQETIDPHAPLAVLKRLSTRPVVGAALLAADNAGVATDEPFMSALHDSLPKHLPVQEERGD